MPGSFDRGADRFEDGPWSVGQFALLVLVFVAPNLAGAQKLSYACGVFLLGTGGALIAGGASNQLDGNGLRTDGAFNLSRHPLSGGLVTACVGLAIMTESTERFVASLLLYAFLSLKARAEERLLEEQYGRYAFDAWVARGCCPPSWRRG